MRFVSFTYEKAGGKLSDRTAVVLAEPNTNLLAIDVSELDEEDQAMLFADMMAAKSEYMAKTEAIMQKYDAVHKFRYFDPNKMTNEVSEV